MIKGLSSGRFFGLLSLLCALAASAEQPVPVPGNLPIPLDPTAAVLEKYLQREPELWDNYFNLGDYILKSGGSPEAAAQTLLKFPGFHQQHPQDPVAVSNWANDAGSLFYALGLPTLTRPFYLSNPVFDTDCCERIVILSRLACRRNAEISRLSPLDPCSKQTSLRTLTPDVQI